MPCAFCTRMAATDHLAENAHAVVFFDAYPVTLGHCLVVPRRHEPDFFALSPDEHAAIWALVRIARNWLTGERGPDGFNIGVNAGRAAGQTVAHAHLHLIPRYLGDVPDPRGGVRLVIPDKARYWDIA